MLDEYKDRIVIELAGHDHFASLRTHKSTVNPDEKYHNLFVAPSITPWYSNNPGVTSFENDDFVPKKLRTTFMNLNQTIGQHEVLPKEDIEFRELVWEDQYGIDELTPDQIWRLAEKLANDADLQEDYLIRKMGLDPSIPSEFE